MITVNKKNVGVVYHICREHSDNALGLLMHHLNIDSENAENIINDFRLMQDTYVKWLPKKKIKRVKKHIEKLTAAGLEVHRENMHVSVPQNATLTNEVRESLDALKEYGYTFSNTAVLF